MAVEAWRSRIDKAAGSAQGQPERRGGRPWSRRTVLAVGAALAMTALGVLGMLGAADRPAAQPAAAAHAVETDGAVSAAPVNSAALPELVEPPLPPSAERPPDPLAGLPALAGPALPPEPEPILEHAAVSAGMLALREDLDSGIAAYREQAGGIEVAVAVTDLQTGETISVNGKAAQRSGCTVMMFALFAAVEEFQAGRADPSQVGTAIRIGIGSSAPANVYWFLEEIYGAQETGVKRAQEMMRSWNMQRSSFHHVPYYGDGTQDNLLTALETNLALAKLYRGELFSPKWTGYALDRLREIKPGLNYLLPAHLPQDARVAHKIGYFEDWDGWVNNDAGIVTFTGSDGQEKAYAITYLSQKAPTEYLGLSFGAKLSQQVWERFAAAYRTAALQPASAQP